MDSPRPVCLLSYLRLPGILRVTWRAADGVTTFTEYDTSLADRAPSGHEFTALRCTDGEDLPDSLLEDVQRLADGDEVDGIADLTAPLADALIASLGGPVGIEDAGRFDPKARQRMPVIRDGSWVRDQAERTAGAR